MAVMLHKYKYGDRTPGDRPTAILIGYWEGERAPGWPSASDFVDEHWDDVERDAIAKYLEHGLHVPWSYGGPSECRFCGAMNGSAELTDGVYIWPEGLVHYVREHSVRLPVSVIRHIAARSRMRPTDVDDAWWKAANLDS